MLTTYNYVPIIEKWDEENEYKEKIKDCCKKETPEDPNCTDCCYDSWRAELKNVVQIYSREKEIADQLQKRLAFIIDRRSRFRTWLDELNKTEDYAREICYQLDVLAGQSNKIWYNACNAVEAIHILFCMVREFYGQVDGLKTRYDELQVCISKNTDPSLEKGKGILGCLDKYYEKLDIIIKTRDEIIKAILEAVKIANLLRNNIYTQQCLKVDDKSKYDPCKPEEPCNCQQVDGRPLQYGFRTILCELYCEFKCNEKCPDPDPWKDREVKQENRPISTNTDPCHVDCEPYPVFHFPICTDGYKACVEKWYRDDETSVRTLSEELNKRNKSKEALLACKQSLDNAIKEVDPKLRCK